MRRNSSQHNHDRSSSRYILTTGTSINIIPSLSRGPNIRRKSARHIDLCLKSEKVQGSHRTVVFSRARAVSAMSLGPTILRKWSRSPAPPPLSLWYPFPWTIPLLPCHGCFYYHSIVSKSSSWTQGSFVQGRKSPSPSLLPTPFLVCPSIVVALAFFPCSFPLAFSLVSSSPFPSLVVLFNPLTPFFFGAMSWSAPFPRRESMVDGKISLVWHWLRRLPRVLWHGVEVGYGF